LLHAFPVVDTPTDEATAGAGQNAQLDATGGRPLTVFETVQWLPLKLYESDAHPVFKTGRAEQPLRLDGSIPSPLRSGDFALERLAGVKRGRPNGQRGAGDPNGRGSFTALVVKGDQLCFGITVKNIDHPILAHIHRGRPNQNGPIVVPLTPPSTEGLVDAAVLVPMGLYATSAAAGLHRLAETLDADLVVVGSSHRGPLGRMLIGSTATRLLNGARCPVAAAPRGFATSEHPVLRVIGLGYDGSPESRVALEGAARLATDPAKAAPEITPAPQATTISPVQRPARPRPQPDAPLRRSNPRPPTSVPPGLRR
jgi:hypothetical protein